MPAVRVVYLGALGQSGDTGGPGRETGPGTCTPGGTARRVCSGVGSSRSTGRRCRRGGTRLGGGSGSIVVPDLEGNTGKHYDRTCLISHCCFSTLIGVLSRSYLERYTFPSVIVLECVIATPLTKQEGPEGPGTLT